LLCVPGIPAIPAITRADTLMMALLKLWLVQNRAGAGIDLVYTDR
jgi:hypothetical protein